MTHASWLQAGYVALACDLHGDEKLIVDLQAAIGLVKPLVGIPKRTRDHAGAALKALVARPEVDESRVAAIGFCVGGTITLELAL